MMNICVSTNCKYPVSRLIENSGFTILKCVTTRTPNMNWSCEHFFVSDNEFISLQKEQKLGEIMIGKYKTSYFPKDFLSNSILMENSNMIQKLSSNLKKIGFVSDIKNVKTFDVIIDDTLSYEEVLKKFKEELQS